MVFFHYRKDEINIYESINESIDDILSETFFNSTYTEDTSSSERGSYNNVTKYSVTSNDKTITKDIVVRQSVDSLIPSSYIEEDLIHKFIEQDNEDNDATDTNKRKFSSEIIDFEYIRRYIEDLILTNPDTYSLIDKDYYNWKNASDNGISPKLFFYGFLIKKHYSSSHDSSSYSIHTVIISEAYDMSLFDFYKNNQKLGEPQRIGYQNRIQNTKLQETDINIANQLIDLLTRLHTESKLICFDIKPANFVIKINKTGVDVKMIDLDTDWCHDYSPLLIQNGAQRELIKDLSIMILANHFYYYLKWNIFQKYIKENKTKFEEKRAALYTLFCEVNSIAPELSKEYQFINRHYLYNGILERTDSSGLLIRPPADCETLFDDMFTDMHKLKPPEPRISPRTVPGFPIAGGKSKKKKRISKKNKKKRRKTKRKNR